jgi:rod shape-determining protein MreB
MHGRTPADIRVLSPLREGAISDFEATEALIRHFIERSRARGFSGGPRMVVGVPFGMTDMEKRAVRECAERSGASRVALVEEPLAAAIGAGLCVEEPSGHMIVDLGGGLTQIAVLSMAGIVYCRSVRVGGCAMEDAIVAHVRTRHGIEIGPRMAEDVKINLGAAASGNQDYVMAVKGRDAAVGYPRAVDVTSSEIREALSGEIQKILSAIVGCLEHTPPELLSDIVERGILLTGGTSLLRGMDEAIREVAGVAVVATEDPLATVALGLGRILEESPRYASFTT